MFITNFTSADLKSYIQEKSPEHILLVTGKKSYEASGAKKIVEEALEEIPYSQYSDFGINPKIEDVQPGIDIFKKNNCQLIIAVGGGSVIDIAKLINYYLDKDVSDASILTSKERSCMDIPLIAIPTTAGSGSEATHFAVVYKDKVKYSIAHSNLTPDVAMLNASFLSSMSKYQLAVTGVDAVCQSIESLWAKGSNEESIKYAEKALSFLYENLPLYYNGDSKAGEFVSQGAYWAGRAINISKTTACHAISYSLTSYYGVPHGHAVSLSIPWMISHNYTNGDKNTDTRGEGHTTSMIEKIGQIVGEKDASKLSDVFRSFFESLGLTMNLKDLGVAKEDIDFIISKASNPERMANNPTIIDEGDFKELFNSIY